VREETLPQTDPATAGAIGFLKEIMRLKAVPRLGWLLRGVRDVESVAAHSYGAAFIAMLLADRARARGHEVNVERVLRMALLHDLTEARTGDLPSTIKPYFAPGVLHAADERAVREILAPLGAQGEDLFQVWREYEERRTLEARIVKAADKLDLLFQAREYERGGARSLEEFRQNAETDFSALGLDELIGDLVSILKQKRGVDGAD
jgi:putative hydrolase of HD superfamily